MLKPPVRVRKAGALAALLACTAVEAAEWSNTELHLQAGRLDVPAFAGID